MVTLADTVAFLYPAAIAGKDWRLIDDGSGPRIYVWNSSLGPQPTPQQLSDAALPCAKALAVKGNRAEARRRIEAKWPDTIQRSASLGVYPADKIEQMKLDIAAVIEAENNAADQIDAATTVAQVEAVTPVWPNI